MINQGDLVIVTGASGFAGSELVRQLSNTHCRLRILVRASSDVKQFEGMSNLEIFRGNIFDRTFIESVFSDEVQYVFHVAGAYREAGISDQTYWDVHVKSTQLLAEFASYQKSFKRFIHVSTVGVHGHIKNPPADELCEFSPGDIYQKTKLEGELWIRKFSKDNAFPLTVVRPTAIYGPGDRRLLKLFKMAKYPLVPLLGFTDGLYHLIHVEDFSRFLIHVSFFDNTDGQVYICGNEKSITVKDMLLQISRRLGKRIFIFRLPVFPFFILGDVCEFVCKLLKIEPPIYRRRVAFYVKDRSFNTTKMREETGFEYRFNNQQGIDMTTDWYRQNKWL